MKEEKNKTTKNIIKNTNDLDIQDNECPSFLHRNCSIKISEKSKDKLYNKLNIEPLGELNLIKIEKDNYNKRILLKSAILKRLKNLTLKKKHKQLIIDKDIVDSNDILTVKKENSNLGPNNSNILKALSKKKKLKIKKIIN
jgi:hypothetical protein